MTAVVVLGMHRSGTSLVSSVLNSLGVNMGQNGFLEADEGNPHGYWEDSEFLDVNKRILKLANGSWRNPPPVDDLKEMRKHPELSSVCRQLIANRVGKWGWKDPRTCLTIPIWWKFLDANDTKIVVVRRDKGDVMRSLDKLHGGSTWGKLCDIYQERIDTFLREESPKFGYVRFDELIDPRLALTAVEWLADFVEADVALVKTARKVIK